MAASKKKKKECTLKYRERKKMSFTHSDKNIRNNEWFRSFGEYWQVVWVSRKRSQNPTEKTEHTQANHRGSSVEHPVIQIGLLYNSEPKIN